MTTLLDETYAVPLDTARAGSVCAALATEGVGFRHEPWPNGRSRVMVSPQHAQRLLDLVGAREESGQDRITAFAGVRRLLTQARQALLCEYGCYPVWHDSRQNARQARAVLEEIDQALLRIGGGAGGHAQHPETAGEPAGLQPSQAEVFGQEVCDPSARTASSERLA
jgi:hypothetical protein